VRSLVQIKVRDEELAKLRKKVNTTVHILTHQKEKLQHIHRDTEVRSSCIAPTFFPAVIVVQRAEPLTSLRVLFRLIGYCIHRKRVHILTYQREKLQRIQRGSELCAKLEANTFITFAGTPNGYSRRCPRQEGACLRSFQLQICCRT
jgi:hypothetical protein